jgi:DNA-binding response OmpR family regulator
MPRSTASILIIESDPPTLELYRRELSRYFTVLACLSEEEALRISETGDISAVILEPAIDGGDGWQLLSTLSESFRGRNIPIILCSTQDERKRGLQQGAAAFLVKPVLPIELRETVRRIVG